MAKVLCLLTCCLLFCSCGTYVRRTIQHDDGVAVKYPYAYGKFCGPGYPRDTVSQEELHAFWPPVDDIDALCYAHDQCFRAEATSQVGCDSVLLDMLISSQSKYRAKGCWNDATNMIIAFFAKPWGTGHNKADQYSSRVAQILIGVPVGLFWAAIKAPMLPFLRNSDEGTCNTGENSNPEGITSEFLERYNTESLRTGRPLITIPIGTPAAQDRTIAPLTEGDTTPP